MQKAVCDNPECKYAWNYSGGSAFYVTCPRCLKKTLLTHEEKKITSKSSETRGMGLTDKGSSEEEA